MANAQGRELSIARQHQLRETGVTVGFEMVSERRNNRIRGESNPLKVDGGALN